MRDAAIQLGINRVGTPPADGRPWRVLLVDDSPDDRAEARAALLRGSSRRYSFVEADSGDAGLAHLTRAAGDGPGVDLVILDYHLPDMDAEEFVRTLADRRAAADGTGGGLDVPIVVLTGSAAPDVNRGLLRAGANDYVGKEWLTPDSLTRAVENARERFDMLAERRRVEAAAEAANARHTSGLRLLSDVSAGLLSTPDVGRALADWLPAVAAYVGADVCLYYAVDRADDGDPADGAFRRLRLVAAVGGTPPESTADEAEVADVLRDLGGRAVVCFPLTVASAMIGKLGFAARGRTAFAADEVELLRVVSDYAAAARERQRAGVTARAAADRLRLALTSSDAGAWDWDAATDALQWSPETFGLFGVDGTTAAGTPRRLSLADWAAATVPDDRMAVAVAVRDASDGLAADLRVEYRVAHPAHGERWVLTLGRVDRSADGRPARMTGIHLDVTDRHRAEAEVRRGRLELRTITDTVPDIVARFDKELRHTFANRAISAIADGRTPDQVLGKTHRELCLPEGVTAAWEAGLRQTFATGKQLMLEFRTPSSDPDDTRRRGRYYEARLVPERAADGRTIEYVLSVTRDVTPQRLHQAELRRAKEAAERANAAKDQFLAVLSHELRTPLNPVLMVAEGRSVDASLPADVRDDWAMVRRNVELEARLIDDLLDLTRVIHGKLEFRPVPVDVRVAVEQVVAMVAAEAQAKGVALGVTAAVGEAFVLGEPARLQQVLWNLVKNAIKFTPAGGRVDVSTTAADDRVGVVVRDTGAGIDPDVLPKVFDAFEQGGAAVTRQFGGLGLGLAISKAVVDLHGGTLAAASDGRGTGATFTLDLPATADRPTGSAPAANPGPAARTLRILLVEDHVDTARLMSRLLARLGHDVRTAGSVAEALPAAAAGPVDLVISDLGLPDGSGHDLMRQLHAGPLPGVPAIALSGYGMDDDLRRSREAGFRAHLTKPVDMNRLRTAVAELGRGAKA